MNVAGLLLAAGAGRRLGQPKAAVRIGGITLVERGARLLVAGGCAPVVVVTGAGSAAAVAALAEAPWPAVSPSVIVAADWAEGMGASLRAGLAALAGSPAEATEATEAAVVTLVDQPWLGAEAIRRLTAAAGTGTGDALVATYQGRPGHPVLLRRRIWAEVSATARGEVGARAWLRAHPDRVRPVPCDGTGSPADVDRPADLRAATGHHSTGAPPAGTQRTGTRPADTRQPGIQEAGTQEPDTQQAGAQEAGRTARPEPGAVPGDVAGSTRDAVRHDAVRTEPTGADEPELVEPERLFAARYQGVGQPMVHDGRHAWLRVTPEKITSWDFRKMRG